MSDDPWKHRSAHMRCETCMWFVLKKRNEILITTSLPDGRPDLSNAEVQRPKEELPAIGRCRRHAPTMSGYPVVFPTDWCGDHKLDESKL